RILQNGWHDYLKEGFLQAYYLDLRQVLKEEYETYTIYPHMNDIFNALHYTSFSQVQAVILGQDPYHGPNQAHGLSFSVQPGVPAPPSLENIFTELENDLGIKRPANGHLQHWA